MKFSIIIPSYNNPSELSEMLGSVKKHCPDIHKHEVLVVDDGSYDDSIKIVCESFSFVSFIKCDGNRGVAAARNTGVSLAKHEILVFLDSDVLVESDFISILTPYFEKSDVFAVSGTLADSPANPSMYRNYWSIYKDFNMPRGKYTTLFLGQEGAIRKSVFEEAGRWDDNIKGVSKEEYEFTERFERLGYKIHYEPKFIVRPRFNGFWTLAPENFRRTKKWCIIFLSRRKFDDYTSTFSGGMSYLLGALSVLSGVLAFFIPLTNYFLLGVFSLYMMITMKFWLYICKKKGISLMLISYVCHFITSLFIFFGALCGLMYIFAGDKLRRNAINN